MKHSVIIYGMVEFSICVIGHYVGLVAQLCITLTWVIQSFNPSIKRYEKNYDRDISRS